MKMNIRKYLAEGILIVFSVLFALFINKLFDDYKTAQKKKIAIESIEKELYRNQAILKRWKEKHTAIRDRIAGIISNEADSLKAELNKYDHLNLGVLTNNESLIDAILVNTAWESAKTTGILAEFDFETMQKLTHVYTMQTVVMEKTLSEILDYYFDVSTHDLKKLDQIMVQFHLRFRELTGQEQLLTHLYSDAIKQITD